MSACEMMPAQAPSSSTTGTPDLKALHRSDVVEQGVGADCGDTHTCR